MSSHDSVSPSLSPAENVTAATTLGASLKNLRQSRNWSLEEVSSRIKFGPRQIDALENERWNELPTGLPLRGLVRNYARLLGADEQSVLAMLGSAGRGSATHLGASNLPASRPSPMDEERAGISWGWLLTLLVFVIAAVAYAFWQGWLPRTWLPAGWFK